MNQALIDSTLLLSAAIVALLIVRFTKQRTTGAFSAFFLLFSPLVVFLNMWAHTVAVALVNYKRLQAGGFQYNFSFYGLMLLGVVFIVVSGINISCSRKRIKGNVEQAKNILWLNGATALLFLPLFPLNPIALLPVFASFVSTISLFFLKSSTKPAEIKPFIHRQARRAVPA
ncbi:MAG TPA: hypothetical protein VEZ55_02390 [Chitinophagaceae bacterium]|nr:hypothetical protein [Chitinophagaceae bacterium]